MSHAARALLLAVLVLPAVADTVVTRDGRRFTGKVTRVGGEVVVVMRLGTVHLDAAEVLRIEPEAEITAELARRRAALPPGDLDGQLALADWAASSGLRAAAIDLLEPLRGGPRAEDAGTRLARLHIDAVLERAEEVPGAEQLGPLLELGPIAARVLLADHAERSVALAARLERAGPLDPAGCARLYRVRRDAVWSVVGEAAFQRATPERARLATRRWRALESLYGAESSAAFLRAREAPGFAEIERLETLALELAVPVRGPLAYEDALRRHGTPLDRVELARALGRSWEEPAATEANARHDELDEAERALVRLINRYRDALLIATVRAEPRLSQAALDHTRSMIARSFFAHASPLPGRREPADRVAATGYPWSLVGEVLARHSNDPAAIFDAFLASPSHHYALVVPRFREIGVGREGEVWTAVLGVRRD